ncbi:MAG: nucleotidyltransferase domain-containing protein [Planctomycetota bacterium]
MFGSVLREDFGPDSDVDVLVRFFPEAEHSLFDIVRMQKELKLIFRREVDIVSRRGIESSRNYLRKQEILNAAEVIYGS